jgi:hypothetical protein
MEVWQRVVRSKECVEDGRKIVYRGTIPLYMPRGCDIGLREKYDFGQSGESPGHPVKLANE